MVDRRVLGRAVEAADLPPLLVVARVALRGQHHARRRAVRHLDVEVGHAAPRHRLEQGERVRGQEREQDLGLGVAEAAVELDHARRPVRVDHQADVEDAAVRDPVRPHAVEHGPDDLGLDPLADGVGDDRGRRVGAHPARVGPGVALADPLVVLGRREEHVALAVGEDEHAGLLAPEKVLDDDRRAGRAERAAFEEVAEGLAGGLARLGDHDALARREPVGLEDDRERLALDVGAGLVELAEPERPRGRGRDAVALHDALGERLRPLEPRRRLRRADDGHAGLAEPVRQPGHERDLGPDDDEVHAAVERERDEPVDVVGRDGHVLGDVGRAGVAGRAEEVGAAGAPGEGEGERVLAPTGADDEDGHG